MSPAEAVAGGVWVTYAELARRRGVSRAAITKRVTRLAAEQRVETRAEGSSRLVELASFDRAVGEAGDAVKTLAAETARNNRRGRQAGDGAVDAPRPAGSAGTDGGGGEPGRMPGTLAAAQTERAQYEARLKALDLAERQRLVLPIRGEHGVETAVTAIGIALARDADGLARWADEIATAVSKDGVAGARRVLKEIGVRFRETFAASLAALAADGEAAEKAGPIETETE